MKIMLKDWGSIPIGASKRQTSLDKAPPEMVMPHEVIEIDGDKGKIFFTGEFSGVAKHGSGSPHNDVRDIEADLVKNSENEWKFTRMTIRKVLEK